MNKLTKILNQKQIKWLIIVVLIIIAIIFLIGGNYNKANKATVPNNEEVLSKEVLEEPELIDLSNITNKNDIKMEDIGLDNYNENRILKIKVKEGDKYVFESDFIKPSEVLDGDIMKNVDIVGKNKDLLAEVYTYTLDGELIGQINVPLN